MSFHLNQTGDVRRRQFEVSAADFKERAAEGFSFWRGFAIGLLSGVVITYGLFGGIADRLVALLPR